MFKELKENTFKELKENTVLMNARIGNPIKEMKIIKKNKMKTLKQKVQ